jgi:large subunit ribosomal protein L31e
MIMAGKPDSDERIVTIPLRKEFLKAPRARRANRAMKTIRSFLERHMKAEKGKVRISQKIHEEIWKRGIHKPPSRIRVKAKRDSEGVVRAMLPDEVEPVKEEKKAGLMDRLGKKKEPGTGEGGPVKEQERPEEAGKEEREGPEKTAEGKKKSPKG